MLVFPDADHVKRDGLNDEDLKKAMETNRKLLNKLVRNYEGVSKIEIHAEEFIKTPKRSIKRYLYEQ